MYTRDGMLYCLALGAGGTCIGFLFCFLLELFGQHGRVMGGTARASDMGWGGRAFGFNKNCVALGWCWVWSRFVCLGREGGPTALRNVHYRADGGGGLMGGVRRGDAAI